MQAKQITMAEYFGLHGEPQDGPSKAALMANAADLLEKVNRLLTYAAAVGVHPGVDQISKNECASGYRPAAANAATANAASASTHLTCQGIDIQDTLDGKRQLARWCLSNLHLLRECGLWMEHPGWTGGRTNTDPWVHLQSRPPGSRNRVYVPSKAPRTAPALDEERELVPANLV